MDQDSPERSVARAKMLDMLQSTQFNDGFDNFVSKLGLNNENTLSAGEYTFNMVTRNRLLLEAAYRGSWIVGRTVDCVAEDMTRAGCDFSTNEADVDINDFRTYVKQKATWQSLCSVRKWARLYGGAIAVMQIEGQDPRTPLDPSTVGRGQYKGLAVYDRWQIYPSLFDVIKSGPDIGLPKYYQIVSATATGSPVPMDSAGDLLVHHSRVIRQIGIELPFFQAITEMMWGESELERMWDRLISFDSAAMSAANLIERANNRVISVDGLREIIAAGGQAYEALLKMFDLMRVYQTNEGITLLDKSDEFQSVSYTFAGLADILIQQAEQLSGSSTIPLMILFGQDPAGFSTGDAAIRNYYDRINAKQEFDFRPGLERLFKVMWRSKFGMDQPKDFNFTFVPLWQLSEKDKADIAKTNTETVLAAHADNVIDTTTAMKELRDLSGNTGVFANITDEDIAAAEEADVEDPPMPADPSKPTPDPAEPDNLMPAPAVPNQLPEPKDPKAGLDSMFKTLSDKIKKWAGR